MYRMRILIYVTLNTKDDRNWPHLHLSLLSRVSVVSMGNNQQFGTALVLSTGGCQRTIPTFVCIYFSTTVQLRMARPQWMRTFTSRNSVHPIEMAEPTTTILDISQNHTGKATAKIAAGAFCWADIPCLGCTPPSIANKFGHLPSMHQYTNERNDSCLPKQATESCAWWAIRHRTYHCSTHSWYEPAYSMRIPVDTIGTPERWLIYGLGIVGSAGDHVK